MQLQARGPFRKFFGTCIGNENTKMSRCAFSNVINFLEIWKRQLLLSKTKFTCLELMCPIFSETNYAVETCSAKKLQRDTKYSITLLF